MADEDEVRALVERLGRTINADLNRSEAIAECVRRLSELGFELTLYLEATLLLARSEAKEGAARPARPRLRRVRSGSLKLNERDVGFLKSLRISLAPPRRRRAK